MIKFGFGGKAKPKSFDFKPRFYDEARDDLQEKIKKFRSDDGEKFSEEAMKNRIRSSIRNKAYGDPNSKSRATRQSNIRLLYIIAILILAVYILMTSNKIVTLLEGFSK